MDLLVELDKALETFGKRLAAVGPDQWTAGTPCTEWDVSALVRHVIEGNAHCGQLLRGEEVDRTPVGDDLTGTWSASIEVIRSAFREPGAMTAEVRLPKRTVSGEQFLIMRISGLVVHSWDLARAIGAAEEMDEGLVRLAYGFFAPAAAEGSLPADRFGAPLPAAEPEADLLTRLLLACGRNP
ncbi:TIGR03086 family metal-binding protein [Plantactinospora endophytica]|uniref:TIGR03086 family protein n=1 Tax=Plantactinospora endophytica TaxID=673535 RepID=A0ABQ4EB98_9ACTN|nr:TIGR03086 family metal-binding protein [Plantactinospora endophytica]GIG91978.1 TIGR03086 family protein [Plantactinospora endophytica]